MPLITERKQVEAIYESAAVRGWVLPAFNTENLTTTEAILAAATEYAAGRGLSDMPVIIGITNNYPSRPQARKYSHGARWELGMRLFLKELEILTSPGSPYAALQVMIHLDHILWDVDAGLLEWDMGQFSSIMFDASTLSLEENIAKTAAFVEKHQRHILIEGACDVIRPASDNDTGLTTPEDAHAYLSKTGVDIIVANLGTEHRASRAGVRYHASLAREISRRLGRGCLCLHGASSVPPEHLGTLFNDGIRRINIWTALERESAAVLLQSMLKHASSIVGADKTRQLLEKGWLGPLVKAENEASVDYCTTAYRQEIVFKAMKEMVKKYYRIFYG
ncbi:MAG TPA: class II fructose-bisphosphate aldolase [Caldithrix abyssi]|uniref:Class II fructose-bisphosphate aldolase n=1 Tax=Caldithrix abyssi TaxID=187145 RepID=A0A7V1LK13_CALAY|nr:class II fructose-bisphosphate aldolase [Caldithrix abyssi]